MEQERDPRAVVLVEGISDQRALEALAGRRHRDLLAEGISVVSMGGSKNIGRFLDYYGPHGLDVDMAGLCDVAEEDDFRRALERNGLGADLTRTEMEALGFFTCVEDLEDELIRALGTDVVRGVVEANGELDAFHTFQRQPQWRERTDEERFRRFFGTFSGRKIRSAPTLVDALDLSRVPRPLDALLAYVRLRIASSTVRMRQRRRTMAKLIYSALTSLDGYIADEDGNFDWAEPDEEVHTAVNDLVRPVGTHLYGRRMYEVLVAWETMPTADQPAYIADFAAIWQAADKIVYSKTLQTASSARTRIERDFDTEAIRQMKASAPRDITVGGPDLAAQAFKAGLVDECQLFLAPIVVGGGTRSLPNDVRVQLELLDERRFTNGVVHLRYRIGT